MYAQKDNTIPQRTGTRRLIVPWEYRHLRAAGVRLRPYLRDPFADRRSS